MKSDFINPDSIDVILNNMRRKPEEWWMDRYHAKHRSGVSIWIGASDGDMDHIHVFQDVTGDGKLDMDDTRLIEREALKLFRQEGLEEGQLKLFVEDGAYG